jgi:hypothetical protein
MRGMAALMSVAIVAQGSVTSGCSLLFTKGPPPPCTTSNDAPRSDIALAVASVAVAVAGGSIARNPRSCTAPWCGPSNEVTGGGMLLVGGIGTVVFSSSAIVGYSRTVGCRLAQESAPYAQHSPPGSSQGETFTSSVVHAPECSSRGDAPFVCSPGTSGSSELAMDGVGR